MTNISDIQHNNNTQEINVVTKNVMQWTFLGITMASFIIYLYIMAAMLSIYFTSAVARQEVRYVLFGHMLIADLVYLLLSLFLFFASFYPSTYPAPFCYIFVLGTSSTLKIAPYNLAIMSLERYIAICFPLRHEELCTLQRAQLAFAIIWAIGILPNISDIIILILSTDKLFYSQNVICSRTSFLVTPVQNTIRIVAHATTFSMVGLIIIFTYTKIMLVAFRVDLRKSSAAKAGTTVMLHAIQLLLCMVAYSYSIFETLLRDYVSVLPMVNFCFFMCLPRFISPIIYGIRDELFRKRIKNVLCCRCQKQYRKQAVS
ncbi:odorant receptor 131-2-like [Hyperolius riggenbachi]|uniref:odorant receptor 131-2-like n=1 Tax=Hyperolius riggenbachi TaxID=752182 RepID=UPI0035A3C449